MNINSYRSFLLFINQVQRYNFYFTLFRTLCKNTLTKQLLSLKAIFISVYFVSL